jgi:hypothetical protein
LNAAAQLEHHVTDPAVYSRVLGRKA